MRMKRVYLFVPIVLALAAILITIWPYDSLRWPASAEGRIEKMANTLRRIEGPAKWCYPSANPLNKVVLDDSILGICFSDIEAVSQFIEAHPNEYMKRFYRGSVGTDFCEVTLSTVWNDDRIVGSDCYYGIFDKTEDQGVGMTDDPFG